MPAKMQTKNVKAIFTTGAFVRPFKRVVDGQEVWSWAVEEFIDDSYCNGKLCLPKEHTNEKRKLIRF